ncbi:DUF927 domain-containing protein [Serratia marcescens]|uniref:DUF927 domain-containing protein n=1 Tax=Serratia marcescens TaxID=615 RepID=UPI0036FF42F4
MTKLEQTKQAARGRWDVIFPLLGVTVPPHGQHGPCPSCGGTKPFRMDDKNGDGRWICTHCTHGDGLDLVAKVNGLSLGQAVNEVADVLQLSQVQQQPPKPARREAAKPAPAVADTVAQWLAACTEGQSEYLTGKGFASLPQPLTTTARKSGGVDFPPGSLLLALTDIDGAVTGAQLISPLGDKRLLPGTVQKGAFIALSAPPQSDTPPTQVIITEGYATALTAAQLAAGWVVAAISASNLPNVAQAVHARWPQARIVIAADNDFYDGKENTGKVWAEKAAKAVNGCVTLPPTRHKADWNDFMQENGPARAKEAFNEELVQLGKSAVKLPQGFRLTQEYLWFDKQVQKSDGDTEIRNIKISNPLRVTAITCDADGGNFGRLLEWEDTYGQPRKWAMPMEMLSGSGEELRRILLVNGLSYISTTGEARARLMEYISLCKPERKVTCVNKTGWHGDVYVLQDEVIGDGAEAVILQTASVQGKDFRVAGTLDDWQEQIGRYCVGNSRVAFAVSLAFAAPLLRLVGMDGGGYHLKGESTDGKTTTMKAATSVCGGPDYWHTWRSTGNALEGTASRRNDAAMMLDEIREVDGREAGNIAYMLANGQGKGRAGTDGELRARKQWRLLFFSTGELSLTEHAARAGERTFAGMEVRMLQIPSDSGKYGVFETLHGFDSGKALAEHFEVATATVYGTPFRAWLKALTADLNGMTANAKALMKEYTQLLMPDNAGNQVGRAINRFALVAMAGELATRLGITGWPEGEALRATQTCMRAWLADRGHSANQEDIAALEQVRTFFTAGQFSRFADWHNEMNRPGNMVGWRKVEKGNHARQVEAVTTFYVMPSGWKEICKGYDARKVARLCAEAGFLVPAKDGKMQTATRPPEMGVKKLYVFTSDVLG